eukprot:INCI17468.1.p1 GENE.INCI17468.1~~INCI17468.1.p1  ORF type:complete len:220 (+),score=59.93 INCI17468.1:556-1215(+)
MWISKLLASALCVQGASAGYVYAGDTNAAAGNNAVVLGGDTNQATGEMSVVGGGQANQISDDALASIIGGGGSNVASGIYSTVTGGRKNRAFSNYATVGGGYMNRASGRFATVFGGSRNTAGGRYSVSAGFNTIVTGDYAAAFGFHADGSTPCQNRDDESLVICATTVDIQADLLINGESLSTSRALAETSDDLQGQMALLKAQMDDILVQLKTLQAQN